MKNILAKVRSVLQKPYVTASIALVIAILLLIVEDFMYNALTSVNIIACVILALGGTVAFCSLTYYIVCSKKLNKTRRAKIAWVVTSGLLYNIFWIVPLVIMVVVFNESGSFAGKFAIILQCIAYLMLFAFVFYLIFQRKNSKAYVPFTAVVCILTATMSIIWAGFGKPLSSYMGLDFDSLAVATQEDAEWGLTGVPAYEWGKLSAVYNCGTMLTYDMEGNTGEESYLQVASLTDEMGFNSYCQKLIDEGYTLVGTNQIDANVYKSFQGARGIVHVEYIAKDGEVRIVSDVSSASPQAFSYATDKNAPVEVYQYALLYSDHFINFGGAVEQCGMSYVIKLADGKLFIIDGGMYTQSGDKAVDGYWDFLNEISGTQSGEKLQIACWFCTHGHDDHMEFFYKMMARYAGQYELERVMYNFPSRQFLIGSNTIYTLQKRLQTYAPNALTMKCHTGQQFTLGGMTIDVLYTHEDAFNATNGTSAITNYNDSSTVLRLSFDGVKMLLLGDIDTTAEGILCGRYTNSVFSAEIVQVAHHGFNGLNRLYGIINPQYLFYPQSEKNVTRPSGSGQNTYNLLRGNLPDAKILFARDETFGLHMENGTLVLTARPYIGDESVYDGSQI